MAEKEVIVVTPSVKKGQIRYRGPIEARVLNGTLEGVHEDIHSIADAHNRSATARQRDIRTLIEEILNLRHDIDEIKERQFVIEEFIADTGGTLYHVNTLKDIKTLDSSTFNEERRLRIDPVYGQATTPFNNYRSNFHIVDPRTETLFVPKSVVPTITEIDERGGTVVEGTPRNAFNGQNESYWRRTVSFPIASDVDAVSVQLDVDVPISFASKSNLLTLRPFPEGQVDITEILYSTDGTDPSLSLPGFPSAGVNGAKALRYHFAPTSITKLRVKLRQRNPNEWDGLKLFSYGLQELDLALVEMDKTDDPSFLNNNAVVWQVATPAAHTFNQITDFFSEPAWEVSGSPSGVFFQVYTDAALTNKIWDSFADPDPSSTAVSVATGISTLYIVVALKYQTSDEVSPVLERMGFSYTVN
ncbi:MAG: hypothetical protein ACXABY_21095 [Candidatus Thorarchaeota archaeon]|jgi:hypothetical protein